jgi:hypothetical protein
MLFKQLNLINCYRRHVLKYKDILLLHRKIYNSRNRCSSIIINEKKNENKFDGPSLKDFIANSLPEEQKVELVNDNDKIPYVDMTDLGQNRKGD